MGKVVKAVAGIALAVAIVAFAPQLTPAFLSAAVGTTAATAITAGLLSLAAGLVMGALAPRPGTLANSAAIPLSVDPKTFKLIHDGPDPTPVMLAPIASPWWRENTFWPWEAVAVVRTRGNCMEPEMSVGSWIVIDRHADIRPGDMFAFDLDDRGRGGYMTYAGKLENYRIGGLVKRYDGIAPDNGMVIFHHTNPPGRCHTPRERITYAHKVVSWHPSYWEARKAARAWRSA